MSLLRIWRLGWRLTGALLAAGVGPRIEAAGAAALPPWRHPATGGVLYFVVTDRFEDGDPANNTGGLVGPRDVTGWDSSSRFHYHGGDLRGLANRLDYLQALGVTSVWLTPVMRNKPLQGTTASYHGYWITDFLSIDPHLGTEADLHALVGAAGQRGMRVILDVVLNHTADVIAGGGSYRSRSVHPYRTATGEAFDERALAFNGVGVPAPFPPVETGISFPYLPVVSPGEATLKQPGWLNDLRLYHHRGNASYTGEDFLQGDISGLDDVFTERAEVVQGFIDVYSRWIATFGIAGFRIDTVKHVNTELWQAFAPRMRAVAAETGRADFLQFGEVLSGDTLFLSEWSTAAGLDATLDFAFCYAVRDFVSRGRAGDVLVSLWDGDDAYTDFDSNVHATQTFLGNHDIGRFGWFLRQDNPLATDAQLVELSKLGHALMMFSRGQPVLYYGDEQGLAGSGGDAAARQDMGASQTLQYLQESLIGTTRTGREAKFDLEHPLFLALSQMARLRREHPALARGAQRTRPSGTASVVAFSRIERTERVEYIAAFNQARSGRVEARLETSQPAGGTFSLLYDSLSRTGVGGKVRVDTIGRMTVALEPLQACVWRADRALSVQSGRLEVTLDRPAEDRLIFAPPRTIEGSTFPGRAEIRATVTGADDFAEVTFAFQRPGRPDEWEIIGTDDAPPYRITFRPPPDLPLDEAVTLLATVDDGRGRRADTRRESVLLVPGAFGRFGVAGAVAPRVGLAGASRRVVQGTSTVLEQPADGTPPFQYQWIKDGVPVAGARDPRLSLATVRPEDAGVYQRVVSNRAGMTLGPPMSLEVTDPANTDTSGRLVNLAVRARVGQGPERLIAGFVLEAPGKSVVIRAVGPTLASFGVADALGDPALALFRGAERIAANDQWETDPAPGLGAFVLPPGSKDAVIAATLSGAGYTAQVTGQSEGTGVALVEVYDADSGGARLKNLSARSRTGPGTESLIAGWVVRGGARRLLVRAVGPGLVPFGVTDVLIDPRIELRDDRGVRVAEANDWEEGGAAAALAAAGESVGAFPLSPGSRDAALIAHLPAGGYTATVTGGGPVGRGVVLVEVYELP
jgi:alpha-amylase